MLFGEGLKYGLIPLGQRVASSLGHVLSGKALVMVSGLLGTALTFAEPAIGCLRLIGARLVPRELPLLYCLLTRCSNDGVVTAAESLV